MNENERQAAMKTELTKRTNRADAVSFKVLWLRDQIQRLRRIYSKDDISNNDLKKILLDAYGKRKNPEGRFYNASSNSNTPMTLEAYLDMFLNSGDTLTGYSVMMKNQNVASSAAIEALGHILDERSIYKKEMKKYPEGSPLHQYYNLLQSTEKILANSYYGIQSMRSSVLYSCDAQNSITMSGRGFISCVIYFVESFFANNEKFRDYDDITDFVTNVRASLPSASTDKLGVPAIAESEVAERLCGNTMNPVDRTRIDRLLSSCSPYELTRLYYKNNFVAILMAPGFHSRLESVLGIGSATPLTPEGKTAFIRDICDYCEYAEVTYDRFIAVSTQRNRKISLLTDTDSTFVYLNYAISGLQEGLGDSSEETKFRLVNFIIDILNVALADIIAVMTAHMGIPKEYRAIMNIKNEFVYDHLFMTKDKKNYAGWILSHFGKKLDESEPHLDIKGLAIRKTTVAPSLRPMFQQWLIDDILRPDTVDLLKVYKDFNTIGDKIEASLKRGDTEFLIPAQLNAYGSYKMPEKLQQVRGAVIWNALEPVQAIVPPEKVMLIKLTAQTADCQQMTDLAYSHPEKYNTIKDVVFSTRKGEIDISKFGFTVIAIPYGLSTIPDYLEPFINYSAMKNANMRNAMILLESLGFTISNDTAMKQRYKSNIIDV